jgi:hypothetical protein
MTQYGLHLVVVLLKCTRTCHIRFKHSGNSFKKTVEVIDGFMTTIYIIDELG